MGLMACYYARRLFWLMLLFLSLGTSVQKVFAQEAVDPGKAIPSLLEPVNTASPRDTLQSFLRFTNDAIRRWQDLLLGRDISLELIYDLARVLPYKPGATEGVYELYLYSPGPWIPLRWVGTLPDWTKRVYFEEALRQWSHPRPDRPTPLHRPKSGAWRRFAPAARPAITAAG